MQIEKKQLRTAALVSLAVLAMVFQYWDYLVNPWTRNGQVRANIVQVTPRVSGPLVNLPVTDNQAVKAGDLLFEIDPRTFRAALDQATAKYDKTSDDYIAKQKQVEAAAAQIDVARNQIVRAESQIIEIDAEIEKNKAEYQRQQELVPKRASSQRSLDRASANFESSKAKRSGALAEVAQTRASLLQAEAALAQAQANLGQPGAENASLREAEAAMKQAQLNLEFTQVRASVDGYVTNLDLRLGSHATANQPVLALVDTNSYWVDGFFRETDIGNMQPGNTAVVTLMSYPDQALNGTVDSIGWGIAQQDGSTGADLLPNISPTFEWIRLAQRVPVRIDLGSVPADIPLRVGTTASVMVKTGTSGSAKAPSEAN